MKRTGIVILFFFYLTSCYVCNGEVPVHVYEYGTNYGLEIFSADDQIPYLQPVTRHRVDVPEGFMVTYVKVTVRGWGKPQVSYAPANNYVTISYDFSQASASDYSILAKGIIEYGRS